MKTFGEHVGFRIFMDAILLSLTRKVQISSLYYLHNIVVKIFFTFLIFKTPHNVLDLFITYFNY